jgi:aryl-alcohol dehydrogenase-like predicted oxidoreductase
MAGISNADVAQIDEAREVLGGRLVSVQNQFSPAFRSSQGELEHCAELGIAFLPWSPSGASRARRTSPTVTARSRRSRTRSAPACTR